MKRIHSVIAATLALSAVLAFAGSSHAQVVGFNVVGQDGEYNPGNGEYEGAGAGGGVGRVGGGGVVTDVELVGIVPGTNCLEFSWFVDEHLLVSEDGADSMVFCGGGTVIACPIDPTANPFDPTTEFTAVWSAEYEIKEGEGTGRFANATSVEGKPLNVIAVNDPFTFSDEIWTFSWRIHGKIDLGND